MGNRQTTVVLLIALVLAAMWASGRLERIMKVVFGPKQKE